MESLPHSCGFPSCIHILLLCLYGFNKSDITTVHGFYSPGFVWLSSCVSGFVWLLSYESFAKPNTIYTCYSQIHENNYEVATDPTSRRLILSAWLELRPVTWSSIFVHSSFRVSTKHGEVMAGRPVRTSASLSWLPVKVVSLFKLYAYMWVLVCFPYKFKSCFVFPALHSCK